MKNMDGCFGQPTLQSEGKFFIPLQAVLMHLIPRMEATNANPALDFKLLNWELISGKKGCKEIFFIHVK